MKIGCIIPGGSFMPQGEQSISKSYANILNGSEYLTGHGFDYAEISCGMLMDLTEEEVQSLAGKVKIEALNCFIPNKYQLLGDSTGVDQYVDECLRRMQIIGADTVVFGSGGARKLPPEMSREEGYLKIIDFLTMCEKYCAKYNVTIVLEPLNAPEAGCEFMNLVSECYELQKRANQPHIKLLADIYHMGVMNEPFSVFEKVADGLSHVHFSEKCRTFPGDVDDGYVRDALSALKKAGYDGRITIECGFRDFKRDAETSAKYMRKLLAEV